MRDGVGRVEDGVGRVEDGVARVEGGVERIGDTVARVEGEVEQVRAGLGRVDDRIGELSERLSAVHLEHSGLAVQPKHLTSAPADTPGGEIDACLTPLMLRNSKVENCPRFRHQ